MSKEYTVYWIGGSRDGEELAKFTDQMEAVKFADRFFQEHESEIHTTWGGISVVDEDDNLIF